MRYYVFCGFQDTFSEEGGKKCRKTGRDAFLAQLAERLPSKQKVNSSILLAGIYFLHFFLFRETFIFNLFFEIALLLAIQSFIQFNGTECSCSDRKAHLFYLFFCRTL